MRKKDDPLGFAVLFMMTTIIVISFCILLWKIVK